MLLSNTVPLSSLCDLSLNPFFSPSLHQLLWWESGTQVFAGFLSTCHWTHRLEFMSRRLNKTFSTPRILFWTDWDATFPRIEAASMSGVGRHIVFKDMETGAWPNGLTLDHLEKRIVWTDARY